MRRPDPSAFITAMPVYSMNEICDPSGDHDGSAQAPKFVIRVPSTFTSMIESTTLKAMRHPSGDPTGYPPAAIRAAFDPLAFSM